MTYFFKNVQHGNLLPVTNITTATKLDIMFSNGYTGKYKDIRPGITYTLNWVKENPLQPDTIRVRLMCYDRYSYLQINGARIKWYNITVENDDESMPEYHCCHKPCWDKENQVLSNGIFQRVPFKTWEKAVGHYMLRDDVVRTYNNIRLPVITCDDRDNPLPIYTFYMPYDYNDRFGNTHNQHTVIPVYTGIRALNTKQIVHLSLPKGRLYDSYRIADDAEQYMDTEHIILRYVPWGLRIDNIYKDEVIGKATLLKVNRGGG
jgi:hypothetical protein